MYTSAAQTDEDAELGGGLASVVASGFRAHTKSGLAGSTAGGLNTH